MSYLPITTCRTTAIVFMLETLLCYNFLELKTVRFYGQFRVPGLTYTDSLKDNTTADYKTLRENVTDEVCWADKCHGRGVLGR